MRLCSRCNQWGETAEPCTCTEELIDADQDVAELKAINGRLQYQNDRLSAKVQKLELAEKMAREARVRMVAVEQRAEKAEKRVDVLSCSTSGMEKLLAEIAKRAGVEDGDVDGLIEWAEKAEQAETDLSAIRIEVAEILHNRQEKIEALKTAERNAVRECARIADGWDFSHPDAGIGDVIRNRYPQHFKDER